MVCDGAVASAASKRQSSTLSACSENSAKLTPAPSQVAPSGYERPGQTRMGNSVESAGYESRGRDREAPAAGRLLVLRYRISKRSARRGHGCGGTGRAVG